MRVKSVVGQSLLIEGEHHMKDGFLSTIRFAKSQMGFLVEETPDLRSMKGPGMFGEWQIVWFGEQKDKVESMVEKAISLIVETEAEELYQGYRIKDF